MGASYTLQGDVAVFTLDNPPVNGLGYDTRVALAPPSSTADRVSD